MDWKTKRAIIEQLEDGLPLRLASMSEGYELSEAKAALKADPLFASQVRVAIAKSTKSAIKKIRDADEWKAAAWWLERTQKEDFGQHSTVTVEASDPDATRRELALLINPRALMAEEQDDDDAQED